jgi:hypothetical protein
VFAVKSVEEIKNEITKDCTREINFPESASFPFHELYKEIVTKIKTLEISSECILYNSVDAAKMTKSYSNVDTDSIKNYWFIGQTVQGDYWIMDTNGKVYFYDHTSEETGIGKIIDLNITFGKWLQYAYLNKEFDKICNEYREKLKEISGELMKNYPFEIG